MTDISRPRVAMIGMDAAELSFIQIQHHLRSLPTLRRILDSGTLYQLGSTGGVFPGSVWPTFYSGTLPGQHGIYHHLQWDSDAMQLRRVTASWLYVEPFWYELERRGYHVAAIDVPMSFPSRLMRGIEIINWGSHDELGPFRAHPRRLAAEIRSRFGYHPMGSEIPVRKSRDQLERVRRRLVAGALLKGELSRWVLAQAKWDFYLTVFGETHRGGHLLWSDDGVDSSTPNDSLLEVYQAVDRGIGKLLADLSDDTTVIVFALHGMGSNDSQEHFMPRVMDRVNARFVRKGVPANSTGGRESINGQRSIMRVLREHLPAGLQNAVAHAVPVAIRDAVVSRQVSAGHDWAQTPGIPLLADLNGYLRWNLRGRERRGMLAHDGEELEHYVAWVKRCLTGLSAPELRSGLVRDVLLSCDYFPGRRVEMLPDAVVTWNGLPPITRVNSDEIGSVSAQPSTGRGGNHRADGFCVIVGGTLQRERHIAPPRHISDLSGLVCALLGHTSVKSQS